VRRQAAGHAVEELHEHREAEHLDEGDRVRIRTEGGHEGARAHGVLGQQDHVL